MQLRAHPKKALVGLCAMFLAFSAMTVAAPTASAGTITQGPNASGTTDVVGSANFTDTLSASSGSDGTAVFTTSTPGFAVNLGNVLASTGTLATSGSPYTIIGTDVDSDNSADTGTWSYSLTVTPDTIIQGPAKSGSTSVASSSTFTDTLSASSGFVGPVTFTTSTPGFAVNLGNVLASTGTLATSGSPYTIIGG